MDADYFSSLFYNKMRYTIEKNRKYSITLLLFLTCHEKGRSNLVNDME
jgi:hypothetical protein